MQIKLSMLVSLLFVMNSAWADLNGVFEDNGDGTYTVKVDNGSGHQYEGLAIPQSDGTLKVDVHDHNENSYSGVGLYKNDGEYRVNFQNDTTGHLVDSRIIPAEDLKD